jgi:hypothetical protein
LSASLPAAIAALDRVLSALGRPYAVIGGVAMIARARVRPTQDVDVVLAVGPEDLPSLLLAAEDAGFRYEDDARSRELFEAGLVHLSLGQGGAAAADIIFADSPFLERVMDRATPVSLAGTTLRVATVEDLFLLKLDANRPIDIDDAIALKDAHGARWDRGYIDEQSRELGLSAAVESLLGSP